MTATTTDRLTGSILGDRLVPYFDVRNGTINFFTRELVLNIFIHQTTGRNRKQ